MILCLSSYWWMFPSCIQHFPHPGVQEIKKCLQCYNIFIVSMATLLRPGHTVTQGQMVAHFECVSDVVHLCQVSVV
jgi:hypothetical protein